MGAEFFREMARKPYVINGVLYSNALWKAQADDADYMNEPYLSNAKWAPKVQAMSNEHGEWIFRLQCATCHTLDGGYRNLMSRTESWTPAFGVRFLENLHEQGVMPPFQGTLQDRAALTSYFLSLHGNDITPRLVLETYQNEEKAKAEAMKGSKKEGPK